MPRHRVLLSSLGPDASQFNAFPFQLRRNIAMREPNMLEPVPGYVEVCDVLATHIGKRIWSFKTLSTIFEMVLWYSGSTFYACRAYDATSENTPTVADDTLLGEPCGAFEARDHVFYAGPLGTLAFDADFAASRMLGMIQPSLVTQASVTTTNAGAVPATSTVEYRATLHRKESDGYEISSAPSYVYRRINSDPNPADFTIRVGWVDVANSDERVRTGDVVRLWRTRSVASGSSPNARFLLSLEHELEAADITARYIDIRDTTPDASLAYAEELYTNPGIQGELQANTSNLGQTTDAAYFNDHAFYAVRQLPSFLKVGVNSVFGNISTASEKIYGIGQRTVVGDIAIGSPTISSLSASELQGIAIGQAISVAGFTAAARVQSINSGAGTVTANENSTATTVGATIYITDVVSMNGNEIIATSVDAVLTGLHTANEPIVTNVNQPVTGALMYGVQLFFQSVAPYGAAADDITFASTNHANWAPQATAFDWWTGNVDERANRLLWSKLDQPDHVPAANELAVGHGEIIRLVATQDRLYVFCTDGLYVVTGYSGQWNVEIFDRDIVIASQQAVDEMNGAVYVYAKDRGLLRIDPSGAIENLTKGVVQQMLIEPWITSVVQTSSGDYAVHVVCDELHDEIGLFFVITTADDARADYVLVFSERTKDWRRQTPGMDTAGEDSNITCWAYSPKRRSVVWVRTNTGGEGQFVPALLKNQPDDDDDTTPIPGAEMMTYPIVPDDDPASMKRFHEVMFTFSARDTITAANLIFTASTGATLAGAVTTAAQALAGNPTPTPTVPAFFQLRHLVTRANHIATHLVINLSPDTDNDYRWRLHAIDVSWEPASVRSYNR